MKHCYSTALLLLCVGSANAADLKHGEQLHQVNCIQCHAQMAGGDGSALYTRADRRVTSLSGLETQVRRCRDNLGLVWYDEDVTDVAAFLNTRYYHFKE
jgi:mono/diheme cytochrome c family protein